VPRRRLLRPWAFAGALLSSLVRPLPSQTGVEVAPDPEFTAVLQGLRDRFHLPALAAVSVIGDSVVDLAAVGHRVADSTQAALPGDRWHIGSLTKGLTASLAALLVERGVIRWTTTVAEALPALARAGRPEFRDVRLEELLHHTAGLVADVRQAPLWAELWTDRSPIIEQRRRFVGQLLSLSPDTARGAFLYSNANYIVAGAMLEAQTGRSWEEMLRDEVLRPLGMDSTGFGAPGDSAVADEPWGHRAGPRGWVPVSPGRGADNPVALGPAGTVHTTLADFARYMMAQLGVPIDGTRLLGDDALRILHTPAPGTDYAMGWGVSHRGWARGVVLHHAGSNTLWYAVVWLAPKRRIGLFAVTNAVGDEAVSGTDAAVGALLQRIDAPR